MRECEIDISKLFEEVQTEQTEPLVLQVTEKGEEGIELESSPRYFKNRKMELQCLLDVAGVRLPEVNKIE